jgi:predicted O-methyltransferase YrrM
MKFLSLYLISKKIYQKIINFFYQKKYNFSFYEKEQNYLFNKLNLDRKKGLKKIENIKNNFTFINNPMSSEHEILFSSISIKNNNIKNILEIGTYNGINSFLLSKLFPKANITTLDLDENDEVFKNYYNRQKIKERNMFIKKRKKILTKSKNIFFKKKNSVKLLLEKKKYDLIWIDGAHGYPFATIDILNSIRLLSSKGMILCDDVWLSKPDNQDFLMYNSIASYETLNILKNNDILTFHLLYKRLDKYNNSNPKLRKFTAFIKTKKSFSKQYI